MSPSSTSSSDDEANAPAGFGRLDVRAALLALAVLVAVELGVVRSGYLWRRAPNTMVGAFYGIEREVLAKAPPPKVVFLGSSRMRDAVDPRELEEELTLSRGGVLNLGLTGGTPFEAHLFYARHRPLLKQARVIVVGVEDWYWNAGTPRDEVERAFATFGDRFRWFEERHEIGDLVGGVWRTAEVQDPLVRFGLSFAKGVKPVKFKDDRMVWRAPSEARDIGPATTNVQGPIAHMMQGFRIGPAHEDSLRALLREAHADGVRVVLTQLPLRAAYVDELERLYPAILPHLRERTAALAAENGAEVKLYDRGTSLGIPDDRFYDYGHFTVDGSRRMNAVWKDLLGDVQ